MHWSERTKCTSCIALLDLPWNFVPCIVNCDLYIRPRMDRCPCSCLISSRPLTNYQWSTTTTDAHYWSSVDQQASQLLSLQLVPADHYTYIATCCFLASFHAGQCHISPLLLSVTCMHVYKLNVNCNKKRVIRIDNISRCQLIVYDLAASFYNMHAWLTMTK